MEDVTIYLRTTLFTVGGEGAHVPPGTMIIRGSRAPEASGGVTVTTSSVRSAKGKELPSEPLTLHIPWSKVDHMVIH